MATIVHVGYFPLGLRPGFQHGVQNKISNGFIRNGHLVLNFSDRDMARALSFFGSRSLGFGRRNSNRALLEFCTHHRPDVLLLGHADIIEPETVQKIRALLPDMRVAQWNVDPLFTEDNVARIRSKQDVVDITFVSTAGQALRDLGAGRYRVAFLPNPVDASIEHGKNHLKPTLPYDLFYVCGNPGRPLRTICGQDWNMNDFFQLLIQRLPHVKMLLGGLLGHPHIRAAEYQSALESAAFGINISRRPDYELYSSDRIAHLAGNGLAVLIERATGYDRFFSDDEMVFYESLDELVEKIDMLARDHPRRQAIASAGYKKYYTLFNERTVAKYIYDVVYQHSAADSILNVNPLVNPL